MPALNHHWHYYSAPSNLHTTHTLIASDKFVTAIKHQSCKLGMLVLCGNFFLNTRTITRRNMRQKYAEFGHVRNVPVMFHVKFLECCHRRVPMCKIQIFARFSENPPGRTWVEKEDVSLETRMYVTLSGLSNHRHLLTQYTFASCATTPWVINVINPMNLLPKTL